MALFNRSWDLLDQTDRSPDDDAEMPAVAFASRWHWGEAGSEENRALGDHQIAKVGSELGLGELAVRYGRMALKRIQDNDLGGWQLAAAGDAEDRAVIESQLRTVPPAAQEEAPRLSN